MIKILIVEDSKIARTTLANILSKFYHVSAVDAAQSAIESMDSSTPDILMVNPDLAGNSGFELLHEMQSYEDLASVPVILLSDRPETYMLALPSLDDLGVVSVIQRACLTRQQLLSSIQEVISSSIHAAA